MKKEDLGQLVATQAVADLQKDNKDFSKFLNSCVVRYLNEDWGDLDAEDKEANTNAVESGDDRILASYEFPLDASWKTLNSWGEQENKIWIITEWDRSVTTILFPGEY